MKRSTTVVVIATMLVLMSSLPAHAASTYLPPYEGQRSGSYCNATAGARCTFTTIPDKTTGRVRASSAVTVPDLNYDGGRAFANAAVAQGMKTSKSARSITVDLTVRVHDAQAVLEDVLGSANSWARVKLLVTVFVWCSCGYKQITDETMLVDTDPSTPTPSSVVDGTLKLRSTLTMAPGESITGIASAELMAYGDATLSIERAISQRKARASADVSLVRIDSTLG